MSPKDRRLEVVEHLAISGQIAGVSGSAGTWQTGELTVYDAPLRIGWHLVAYTRPRSTSTPITVTEQGPAASHRIHVIRTEGVPTGSCNLAANEIENVLVRL